MNNDDVRRDALDRFVGPMRAENDAKLHQLRIERERMRPAEDAFIAAFRAANDAESSGTATSAPGRR